MRHAAIFAALGSAVPAGSTPVNGTANFVVPTSASAAMQMLDVDNTQGTGVALVGINWQDAALA